jgi:tetratricopeptide (TPR) repeat protein
MISLLLLQLAAVEVVPAEAPVRALQEARDLLYARQFAELTALVETQHREAARDPALENQLGWTLEVFYSKAPEVPRLIDEWVQQDEVSWAPLLAKAMSSSTQASLARGTRWASETKASQFEAMERAHTQMRAACAAALAREPKLCQCHIELTMAAKHYRGSVGVLDEALEACPLSYVLHVERVFGLTPRWGGSYPEMRAAVRTAGRFGLAGALLKNLESYIPADQASVLVLKDEPREALTVLDQAISASPTPLLYQERARLNRRLRDAAGTLRDANQALELSNGGWIFSARRLTDLLVARAWALSQQGRTQAAKNDIALALVLSPSSSSVKRWQERLGVPDPGAAASSEQSSRP